GFGGSGPRRRSCCRRRRFFRLSIVRDRVSTSPPVVERTAPLVEQIDTLRAKTLSEGADEAGDPFVVRLERILAEDRLALRVVQLEVDPVDPVVLALPIGLTDELATQPRPRRLGRGGLGLPDRRVVRDPVDCGAAGW